MIEEFSKRKKDVLSKLDKSNKNIWDERITILCNKINLSSEYYTTSSCSGRIVLMIDQDKKEKNLFVFVYHNNISLEKLKEDLDTALKKNKEIKFKLEPCILHVACRTLEDAQKLYNKAKLAGWKKSGIVGMKNGFTLELNSTERLEFPIINQKKMLVDDEFLKIVIEEANKKLKKSWEKIKKLEKLLID
ncbi:MAG: tRNA wybutosine-synthesizing 3 family protein [Candidatus Pacearchaeota archaeon]|nr:tRNA wybutosine-synthesizing 3 family protein [Candidatus Pacearchaeota archaeon]